MSFSLKVSYSTDSLGGHSTHCSGKIEGKTFNPSSHSEVFNLKGFKLDDQIL